MKTQRRRAILAIAVASVAALCGSAPAADLTWDANGATAGQPDGGGTWLSANQWWDGATNQTWNSGTPDSAIIGNGGNGGAITLGGVVAGRVTFTNFTGTYTLSGGGLTNSGGIVIATNAGSATISTLVSGGGGITKNGAGKLILYPGNSFTGPILVKGGVVQFGNWYGNSWGEVGSIPGNLEINGGTVSAWYYGSRSLGSGAGQIQITGGRSGFSNLQGDAGGNMWTVNADANYEVVWGSTYFNPSTFVLNDNAAAPAQYFKIPNKFDLNGADRTIECSAASVGGVLTGVIRTSSGTAGIIKIGIGDLQLTAANTYNGGVTINGGTLTVASMANGGSASGLGASSNSAANVLLANGTTLKYTGGAANSDRSFTLNGTAAGDAATLDASGTGALVLTATNSPAYGTSGQTRTLILGGTSTYTNTLAANIADNGGAAVSVTKTNTGLWVLSGANTYSGPTTLSGGTLSISTSNNLGAASANLVFNGGTLQIAGTGLASLTGLGRTVVVNPGVSVGFDIASAANTFTVDRPLGGFVNVVKTGPGALLFNQANSYAGVTTINGGALQYNDGSAIPTTPLVNNGALVVNRTDTLTQGATFHSLVMGTGTVTLANSGTLALNNINTCSGNTRVGSGTIAVSHPLALRNSALDTTGSGVVTLSGLTALTLGGLTASGAPRDLASVITSGYSSVTNLTLNPAGTVTYGGGIADGAGGMALTMAGAGTQGLQGANPYSGATYLNGGTLELSGSGSIPSSAVTFSGGGLKLSNTAAETGAGRISDSAAITARGGTLTYNNTSGGNVYAETIGAVTLNSGQLDIVEAVNQASTGSQTLTLSGLSQAGSASVTFSAAGTAPDAAKNMIVVSGAGTTVGGRIMGPWATVGTAASAQTDYAVYSGNCVVPAGIAASAETTWMTLANAYTLSIAAKTASALTLTRNITALKESSTATAATAASGTFTVASAHSLAVGDPVVLSSFGGDINGLSVGTVYYVQNVPSSTTFTLAATPGGTALNVSGTVNFTGGLKLDSGINLGTSGILSSGAAPFGIGRTAAGGTLTLPTAGAGNLYVTPGSAPTGIANSGLNGWLIIDAPIVDNGGALTLVKCGSGVLRLSGVNTYTGGTVINAGTVAVTNSVHLGAAGSAITFNGSGALSFGPNNSWGFASGGSPDLGTHPIVLNNGAVAGLYYNSPNTTVNVSGAITGNGGIIVGVDPVLTYNGGAGYVYMNVLSAGNTFTGPLTLTGGGGGYIYFTFNSLADSTAPITFSAGGGGNFYLGAGAIANLSVPNRPINLLNSNTTIQNLSATNTMTLGPVSTTTAGAKTLSLGNGGAGGFVVGPITDGSGQIAVTKSGTGTWTLSGTNTYSGATTISAGTLEIGGGGLLGGGAYAGNISISGTLLCSSSATQAWSGVISGTGTFAKPGSGTLVLAGNNTFTCPMTITNGVLMGVTGGSCAGTAITVSNAPGRVAGFGVSVGGGGARWTCASLAFKTDGGGTRLYFALNSILPSASTAPLHITGNLSFSGVPAVVVTPSFMRTGRYPLLTVGGTAPTELPTLIGTGFRLAWGGTDDKTLYLIRPAPGFSLIMR